MGISNDPRPSVGLIGLGHMGTAIAERLADASYPLAVWNRTAAKAEPLAARGAAVATSAAELAAGADVVLTSLADDAAFEAMAAELLPAARSGAVLVDCSTVSPEASDRVARRAETAGIGYVRAPVSGNPAVVRAGNLAFIVSGPEEAIARVQPILLAVGRTVHDVGRHEEARVVKLAVNLVIAGLAQLMAEALVLGESAGVSRAALLEVMGDSAAGAPFVKYKTDALLQDDFSATFTTALMEKDIDLILDAAAGRGVALPIAQHLKTLLHTTADAGYADLDFMALFLQLRNATKTEALR